MWVWRRDISMLSNRVIFRHQDKVTSPLELNPFFRRYQNKLELTFPNRKIQVPITESNLFLTFFFR